MTPRFWQHKPLAALSSEEWEALCDGCGKCCLHKLEDIDSGELYYTNVACRLLDLHTCRCGDYAHRHQRVADCIQLTPANLGDCRWLPSTCAYRLVAEGKDLPTWHPLVSGNAISVHAAGVSARNRAVSEQEVDDLEDHILADQP